MRCKACNSLLLDIEATEKYPGTNEYIDLCSECYSFTVEDDDSLETDYLEEELDNDIL